MHQEHKEHTEHAEYSGHAYRILVVDDDHRIREKIRRTVAEVADPHEVEVLEAADEQKALDLATTKYIDLVFLDLFLNSAEPTGFELVNVLATHGSCADIVLMTHHNTSRHFDSIMQLVTRVHRPSIINFIRTETLNDLLPRILRQRLDRFHRSRITLTGLHRATALIMKRRNRYPRTGAILRTSEYEMGIEIERLCRQVFAPSAQERRTTRVWVDLEALDRRGLSAAVLLRPVIRTGIADAAPSSEEFECVLKLGPVEDAREEVARYEEFVRYGVRLEQRVELLAAAFGEAIGAIVYSFAGGVYGQTLVTLDELLRSNEEQARELFRRLFVTVSWYGVPAGIGEIRKHMDARYKSQLSDSIAKNERSLRKLDEGNPEIRFTMGNHGAPSTLQIPDAPTLTLPGPDFYEEGWRWQEFHHCLVHGDMHGGNVMAEIRDDGTEGAGALARVCLIDYRSAGPGPRCIDAVALESSVRIADAERIAQETAGVGASELSGPDLVAAMRSAARRVDTERQLYQSTLRSIGTVPSPGWCGLSAEIVGGIRASFADPPVSAEEYLQTALLYAVRQLAYPLEPLVRVRVCVWLAALHGLGKELLTGSG